MNNIRLDLWGEGMYSVLVGKPDGKKPLGGLGVDGLIILGWICGIMSVHSVLVGIRVSKCSLGRPRLRWVDNIRMDLWVRFVCRVLAGNRRERANWGDLGIDMWIILGKIFGDRCV